MLKKLSWCVALFVGFLGIVGFSQQSLAAELSSGGFVDSINFDKKELTDGELTSIRVTFSEKSNTKLKTGDTLTLTLPKELEGLADSDSEPRETDLNGLGMVRVYKDKIITTFNEKVNQLDHVRGEFTFGVRVKNVPENTVTEIPANLGTSITVPNIVIKGHTSGGVEWENPFFYKTGDLLGKSGQIRWFLNANLNKSELGNDIVLTDISGGGQVLNKESFVFTIDNYLGRSTLSLEEFENQRYGTVEFGADNAFVIRLYREKARLASFSIMYTATITETGKKQPNFTNDCQIDYQLYYEKASNEIATHKVKNIFLDGNATGDESQQIKEPTEQEEIIEDESNEVVELQPIEEEKAKESQEELNKIKEEQPEIHVGEQTEIVEDESNEVVELQPIEEEKAKESQEEDLNKAKEEQPEIHVGEQTEIIEDESSKLEEIKPIEPEIVEVTKVPPLEPALPKKEIEVRQDKSVTEKIKPSGHAKGELIPVKEEKKEPKNNHVLLTLSKRNATKANEQLPQAGSNDSSLAVFAGLVMIVFTLGAYALNRKKITK